MSWLTSLIGLLSALLWLACLAVIFFGLLMALTALARKLGAGKKSPGRLRALARDDSGLLTYHADSELQRVLARNRKILAAKQNKDGETEVVVEATKPVAVLAFDGTIQAKGYRDFGKLVDEIEINKDRLQSVVVRVTSPGGTVPEYGYLCAEMERIRNLGLPLTVCVDTVAASGGYLMSLPANKIVAAPFAIVGSIGVVAFVPNARKLLERLGINPRTFTAGRYKRTVTMFDNETDDSEGSAEFRAQLEAIHEQFIAKVKQYRPNAKLDVVTTGAHWSAQESVKLELGLVDEISTSSAYLLKVNADADLVYFGQAKPYRGIIEKLSAAVVDRVEERLPDMLNRLTRDA